MAPEKHPEPANRPAREAVKFPTTHWNSVLAAREGDLATVQAAMGKLCARYHPAILAYFRLKWKTYERWGHVHDAEDLTQSFVQHLLEAQRLTALDPRKVRRFRHYLVRALDNFLKDQTAKILAQRRGGGQDPLPVLQPGVANGIDVPAPDPEMDFAMARSLAMAVHQAVIARLRADANPRARFERLRHFLVLEPEPGDYARAAEELAVSQDAIKQSVSRWKASYADLFLGEFRQLVANDPSDIQGEVKEMLEALYRAIDLGELEP